MSSRRRVAIAVIVMVAIAAVAGRRWIRPGSRATGSGGAVASSGSAHGGARGASTGATSDGQGRFTIDPAPAGMTFVMCNWNDDKFGHAQATVVAGQRSSATVTLSPRPTRPADER